MSADTDAVRPLVHIGYHKTGTTWLQKSLFASPRSGFAVPASYRQLSDLLVFPDPLDYDAAATRDRLLPLLASAAPGRVPVVSVERLSGMPMQGGYDQKEMADRLAATLPEARILIVIREQQSIILSTYRHYVRQGGAIPLPDYLQRAHGPLFSLAYFEYDRLIRYYRERFGAERVRVLAYETFRREPAAFIGGIAAFCGLPPVTERDCLTPFAAPINAGETGLGVAVLRRANRLLAPRKPGQAGGLVPVPVGAFHGLKKLLRGVDRLVPAGLDAALVRGQQRAIRAAVGECFGPSNARTARMSGLDLGALGYRVAEGGRATS